MAYEFKPQTDAQRKVDALSTDELKLLTWGMLCLLVGPKPVTIRSMLTTPARKRDGLEFQRLIARLMLREDVDQKLVTQFQFEQNGVN